MNLKDLEKINKIYPLIKQLDDEINKLDKLAISLVNGECDIDLSLKITDLKLKDKSSKQNMFDEDGSLMNNSTPRFSL